MSEFIVFAKHGCPFCKRALELIISNIDNPNDMVVYYPSMSDWNTLPGFRTFPQIIQNDTLIGGYDDLIASQVF